MSTPTHSATLPAATSSNAPQIQSPWRAPRLTMRFWPVFQRNLLVWRKLAIPSLLGNIAEPLMWLVAFGYGMGALVGPLTIDGQTVPYILFLASGSICMSAMNAASFEALYSAFSRMHVQKTWDGIMNAPVGLDDIVVLLGVGITFSSMALVFNALAKGYDFFTYYFTLFLTPTMFLGGVFFPLEQLPPFVRAVADWLPLANAVALVRPLFMDQWPEHILFHGGVLLAYAVVSFWVALALTRKRFGQ